MKEEDNINNTATEQEKTNANYKYRYLKLINIILIYKGRQNGKLKYRR